MQPNPLDFLRLILTPAEKPPVLAWRLLFAVLFLIPLVGLMVVDFHYGAHAPGIWLLPFMLLFVYLAAGEFVDLISPAEHRPPAWLVQFGVVGIVLASAAPLAWGLVGAVYPPDCPLGHLGWPLIATALAVTVALVYEMRRFEEPGTHVVRIAIATLGFVYLGLFLSFLYPLRSFHDNQWGMAAVISVLLIVKVSDIGAYTFGRMFGRTKLVPRLSPGKTVAGAVGGLASASAASWLFFGWAVPQMIGETAGETVVTPAWQSLLYGVILALAAVVGDLAESMIKRDMQRKDSSGWVRGLGGILDLLDSVIVAAPTAYLCWSVGLVGPG